MRLLGSVKPGDERRPMVLCNAKTTSVEDTLISAWPNTIVDVYAAPRETIDEALKRSAAAEEGRGHEGGQAHAAEGNGVAPR